MQERRKPVSRNYNYLLHIRLTFVATWWQPVHGNCGRAPRVALAGRPARLPPPASSAPRLSCSISLPALSVAYTRLKESATTYYYAMVVLCCPDVKPPTARSTHYSRNSRRAVRGFDAPVAFRCPSTRSNSGGNRREGRVFFPQFVRARLIPIFVHTCLRFISTVVFFVYIPKKS